MAWKVGIQAKSYQANVFGKQQCGGLHDGKVSSAGRQLPYGKAIRNGLTSLLPTASTVLDGSIGLGLLLLHQDGAAALVGIRGVVGGERGEDRANSRSNVDIPATEPAGAARHSRCAPLNVAVKRAIYGLLVWRRRRWGILVRHGGLMSEQDLRSVSGLCPEGLDETAKSCGWWRRW